MHPNPLLPVLRVLSPNHHWPDTTNESFVRLLALSTEQFLFMTRELVTAAEDAATSSAGVTPFHHRADVQFMRLASNAGRDAHRIMRATQIRSTDDIGLALLDAVTAALMYRSAERTARSRGERHDKTLVNRALAAAEWVGAAHHREDILTFGMAARVFAAQLSSPWRWDRLPNHTRSASDQGSAEGSSEADPSFVVTRPLPDEAGYEQVTVTRRPSAPVEIIHRRVGRSDAVTRLSWPELCQHMARSYAATAPHAEGHDDFSA